MAPFGLELGQNESYGPQNFFKPLPALREPVFGPKTKKTQNISTNYRSTAPAAAMLVNLCMCTCFLQFAHICCFPSYPTKPLRTFLEPRTGKLAELSRAHGPSLWAMARRRGLWA